MTQGNIEREVKLAVWPGFVLPALDDVVDGALAVPAPETRLDAVYYDTADFRLAREGITLRHRSDGGWTLKLPDEGAPVGGLSRREITIDAGPRAVPAEISSLVASRVRTSTLEPVAKLQTLRRRTDLVDPEGATVAEVVDDEVSVLEGRRVALRFREVEVELRNGDVPGALDAIVDRLRSAGAGAPDPTPKVVRALGPGAQADPELATSRLRKHPTAADVLTTGFTRAARRLVENDPGVRVGGDDEFVHQARVATRRMRSDLRTFGALLDEGWATSMRDELRWLGDALGEVRDADVLLARIRRQLDGLRRPDRVVGTGLLDVIDAQRASARARLLDIVDTHRYATLLDRVVDGARQPRLLAAAGAPASDVVPRLVRGPWSALEKAMNRIGPASADEELHAVRIRAKRARYAADVAALVIGGSAQRLADEIAHVQDVLGGHQDACVAREWLRRTALDVDAPIAFVAGQLAAQQDAESSARRAELPAAWRRASKGKLRTWLTR